MFSKAEARAWNEQFYTAFGVYMRKHQPLADVGLKWLNYQTGIKDIFFRVEADKRGGRVSIDLQHPDEGMRSLFFEQFGEFRKLLGEYLPAGQLPPAQVTQGSLPAEEPQKQLPEAERQGQHSGEERHHQLPGGEQRQARGMAARHSQSSLRWEEGYELPNGRMISRIFVEKLGLNIYKQDDWGEFFKFFEAYLLGLDAFWADFKPVFEELAS